MSTSSPRHRHPLHQTWPPEYVQRYRAAGYWRGQTMTRFLHERAQQTPQHTAIVGYSPCAGGTLVRWSYADLWRKVEMAAAGFLAHGLQAGDRVVVHMGNVPEFYSVVFGLFRAGLIPVFALPAHRMREIAHFIDKAEASAYVALQQYEQFDYRSLASALKAQARQEQFTHTLFEHAFIVGCNKGGGDGAGEGHPTNDCIAFDAFEALGDEALQRLPSVAAANPDPQAVAFLQISGGSTGLSKLIPRTHDDYIYSFSASNALCGIDQRSIYMVALPAAHNFPMSSPGAFGTLYAGGTVVLSPTPSPEAAFPLIASERVTALGLVPPLALLWAQAASTSAHDLSSLQTLQVGGAKLTPEAARRVTSALRCTLQQVFGMAEGLVNYTRLDDDEHTIIHTQGRPISADDEVLIVDDLGQPVPVGQSGYLLTRGPYTIRSYHNDDAANARSFTADGYYRTGDVVQRTAAGYLIVQGRAGDHINRAGEKISAEEIEDHLLAHPQVFDAAVVSIPDEYLGERSCAFVMARPGPPPRAADIKQWFKNRQIAAFKIPDQIVFVDAFETTAVGKTSRKELRARLRQQWLQGGGNT